MYFYSSPLRFFARRLLPAFRLVCGSAEVSSRVAGTGLFEGWIDCGFDLRPGFDFGLRASYLFVRPHTWQSYLMMVCLSAGWPSVPSSFFSSFLPLLFFLRLPIFCVLTEQFHPPNIIEPHAAHILCLASSPSELLILYILVARDADMFGDVVQSAWAAE